MNPNPLERLPPEHLSMDAFIQLPDTVEFTVSDTHALRDRIGNRADIRLGPTLLDGQSVVYASEDTIPELLAILKPFTVVLSNAIVLGLDAASALDAAGIAQAQNQLLLPLNGEGVLVGIIDTGIDYMLDAFCRDDGTTRITSLWDQTIEGGQPPSDYAFGSEYTAQQIDRARASAYPQTIVPSQDLSGHGTFVASVAAGRVLSTPIGAAPNAELIVVKLRQARPYYREKYCVPPDQNQAYSSVDLILGIDYCLSRAASLGKPLSLCVTLGTNLDGHDGFGVLEEYLTYTAARPGVCVTAAAGQESQTGHHTQGTITAQGDSRNVPFQVGEKAGDLYLALWNTASDRFSVSLTSPGGARVGRFAAKPDTTYKADLPREGARVEVEYSFPLQGGGMQRTAMRILRATPGLWTIHIHGDIVQNGGYHIWLPMTGFVDPSVSFVEPDPNYTILVPATAMGVITVGISNALTGTPYTASSWGPTRLPLLAPDLVAPGVNVAGLFSHGKGLMTGSCVSSALVAGSAALMLQWGVVEKNVPFMNTHIILPFFAQGCERLPNVQYPNAQSGYGMFNLHRSFTQMLDAYSGS